MFGCLQGPAGVLQHGVFSYTNDVHPWAILQITVILFCIQHLVLDDVQLGETVQIRLYHSEGVPVVVGEQVLDIFEYENGRLCVTNDGVALEEDDTLVMLLVKPLLPTGIDRGEALARESAHVQINVRDGLRVSLKDVLVFDCG